MSGDFREFDDDVELLQFLNESDDAAAVTAVASRVVRFADGETLSADFADQVRGRAAIRSSPGSRRLVRWAAVAAILIFGVGLGSYLTRPIDSRIAWGDVVTAMEPVDHFHVAVFLDNSAFFSKSGSTTPISMSQASHFDFYYQKPDLWRAQNSEGIQFAVGKRTRLYNMRQGKFVESSKEFPGFIIPELFGSGVRRKGILDAILGMIFWRESVPASTPVIDPAPSDSGIQVFDYGTNDGTGPSARIWVVQKSRLPIRFQINDAELGPFIWATIDYSEAKPASFFDVAAFENSLKIEGPPTTRDALNNRFIVDDIAAWHKTASAWQEPADRLKYSEVSTDLKGERQDRTLTIKGERVAVANFNVGPAEKLPAYNGNGNRVLAEAPCVFVHERTAKLDGSRRLIAVKFIRLNDLGTAFDVHQIEARGNTFAIRSSALFPVNLNDLAAPGRLRVFAGQADGNDPSRFTIPFEADGKRGVIEGVYLGEQKDAGGIVVNGFVQFNVSLTE